ncbi:MAG: hypothetical protein AB7N71_14360 [Phycisphaerae bacterium]
MIRKRAITIGIVVSLSAGSFAGTEVVFQNTNNNGWFTPFNSSNATTVRYGDSGWLGTTQPDFTLTRIVLGLVTENGTEPGIVDLSFTFHDGDPSGLVFGSGAELYATTITDLVIPGGGAGPQFFELEIALPNIVTTGGFNNIGWSIGLGNFDFDGDFGVQVSSASGQLAGFYTNNASFYNGNSWSLFSFGSDPNTGVANFVATVYTPEPITGALLALLGVCAWRRR